ARRRRLRGELPALGHDLDAGDRVPARARRAPVRLRPRRRRLAVVGAVARLAGRRGRAAARAAGPAGVQDPPAVPLVATGGALSVRLAQPRGRGGLLLPPVSPLPALRRLVR